MMRWASLFWVLIIVLIMAMFGLNVCEPIVPAIYIFGDSTVDVGTNNYLGNKTNATANFLYYGIDFPGSVPTGRFSNGYNTADYIAMLLGFKKSPDAFLHIFNHQRQYFKMKVLNGANFASGGSGLIKDTGLIHGKVISMEEQVEQFGRVHNVMTKLIGEEGANARLSRSLFVISIGGNDIFEYFQFKRTQLDPTAHLNDLLSQYQIHLRKLVGLGAKKFVIISAPPVGCCPISIVKGGGLCLEGLNGYIRNFHDQLGLLLQNMSSGQLLFQYSLGNAYQITLDIINDPSVFGFNEVQTACCGNGNFNAVLPCKTNANLCENRKDHFFWDMFHPTQAASYSVALAFCNGSQKYASPINIQQLAKLDPL